MFLENEAWELCPVKENFSFLDIKVHGCFDFVTNNAEVYLKPINYFHTLLCSQTITLIYCNVIIFIIIMKL